MICIPEFMFGLDDIKYVIVMEPAGLVVDR
jgi:hypothetical protein